MGTLLLLIVAVLFIRWVVRRSGPGLLAGSMDLATLLQQGVPASGILIKVGTQRTLWGSASTGYYEVRSVSIAVEVEGKPPYQCDCSLYVPANLRRLILPGATIELRVNPRSPQNIAVFGPAVGVAFF